MISLCFLTLVYWGPVAPETRVDEHPRVCMTLASKDAHEAIAACGKLGPSRCEPTTDGWPMFRRVTLEYKVRVQ